jgi:hypothetical protein
MILTKHERKYILKQNRSWSGAAIWPAFNLLEKEKVAVEFIGRNFHSPDRGKTENTYIFAIEDGEVEIYALVESSSELIFTKNFGQIQNETAVAI